jgi:hypothetical protein
VTVLEVLLGRRLEQVGELAHLLLACHRDQSVDLKDPRKQEKRERGRGRQRVREMKRKERG